MNSNKLIITLVVVFFALVAEHCHLQNPLSDAQKHKTTYITPAAYRDLLGKGINVDWAKTGRGIANYATKSVIDFRSIGFSHVRIRIKNDISEELLTHLDNIISDCLDYQLIPVLAYQGKEFKLQPNEENLEKVVSWWKAIAERYKTRSYLLSYDILIEVTDELNKNQIMLNHLYEKVVAEIRKIDPYRIIFISPRYRSSPEYLAELKIPGEHDNFLMAEWHFYASGPSRTNPAKLWTTGTEAEKQLILDKIEHAVAWQNQTKILTWVGAWMPGNYNKGNDYTIEEQKVFAKFVACALAKQQIPFAINADKHFYDVENHAWKEEMLPVLNAILDTKDCK